MRLRNHISGSPHLLPPKEQRFFNTKNGNTIMLATMGFRNSEKAVSLG